MKTKLIFPSSLTSISFIFFNRVFIIDGLTLKISARFLILDQEVKSPDRNILDEEHESLLNELDQSFESDLGFSFRTFLSVQKLLSSWTFFDSSKKENVFYQATLENILKFCERNIEGFEETEISRIIDFLTLDDKNLLLIEGSTVPAPDLPIWEHRKRTYRYNIRPLIKIDENYYWGAHSADIAGRTWFRTFTDQKLPSDIIAPNTVKVLDTYHTTFTISLQEKIKEIISRFTPLVLTEVFPRNLGFCNEEIGDIDVFALIEEKNILLNIESKVIDQAFCNKDLKRLSEKIFGRTKSDGAFKEGYLQKVEKRDDLLTEKGSEIIEKVWHKSVHDLKIVSLFVTPDSYWWTKYPPIETAINFVEIRLLEDYIKSL